MIPQLLLENHKSGNVNACFANSVLQMLRNIPPFMLKITDTQAPTESLLRECYESLGSNKLASAKKLRIQVGNHCNNSEFYTGPQQDSAEFLTHLLDLLQHDGQDNSNKKIFNFTIRNEFQFVYNNTDLGPCKHCRRNPTSREESENILKIELPDLSNSLSQLNLSNLIQNSFTEKYNKRGKFNDTDGEEFGKRCEFCCIHGDSSDHNKEAKCKKNKFTVKQTITKPLPSYIIIQLVRFAYNPQSKSVDKNNTQVNADRTIKIENAPYEVVATIQHLGDTMASGHYVAHLKDNSDRWYRCDDNFPPTREHESTVLNSNMYVYLLKRSSNISTSLPPATSSPKINSIPNQASTSSSASKLPYFSISSQKSISTQNVLKVTNSLGPASSNKASLTTPRTIFPNADKSCCKGCGQYFLRNFIGHLNKNSTCKKHYNMDEVMKDHQNKKRKRNAMNKQNSRKRNNTKKNDNDSIKKSKPTHPNTCTIPVASPHTKDKNNMNTSEQLIDQNFEINKLTDNYSLPKINLYFKDQLERSKFAPKKSRYENDLRKDFHSKVEKVKAYEHKRLIESKGRKKINQDYYLKNKEKIRGKAKIRSAAQYAANPKAKKESAKARSAAEYSANPDTKKKKSTAQYASNPDARKKQFATYYVRNSEFIRWNRVSRYDKHKEEEKQKQKIYNRNNKDKRQARYKSIRILKKYLVMRRKSEIKNHYAIRKNKRLNKQKQKDLLYEVKKNLVNYMKRNNLPTHSDSAQSSRYRRRSKAFFYREANDVLQSLKTAQGVKHSEAQSHFNYIKNRISNLLADEETKTNGYMQFIALTGPSQHHNTTQSYGHKQDLNDELFSKKTYHVRSTKSNGAALEESMDDYEKKDLNYPSIDDATDFITEDIETRNENFETSYCNNVTSSGQQDLFSESDDDFFSNIVETSDVEAEKQQQLLQIEILTIAKSLSELKILIEGFFGEKESQEYKKIDEMITLKYESLDALQLNNFDNLKAEKKKLIHYLDDLSRVLESNAKKSTVNPSETGDLSSKKDDTDLLQCCSEKNQYQSKISSAAKSKEMYNEINIDVEEEFFDCPLTTEIQELFSDSDDEFDLNVNENFDVTDKQKNVLQNEISNITKSLPELTILIEDFSGEKGSQEYETIYEMIKLMYSSLGALQLKDFEDLKAEREKIIRSIDELSKMLETNINKRNPSEVNNMNSSKKDDVGLSWVCSEKKCGFHYNKYTSEALVELRKAYQNLVILKYQDLEEYIPKMFKCTAERDEEKRGHSLECYDHDNLNTFLNKTNCQDPLLVLKRLYEHFPTIRTITRRCYALKQSFLIAKDLQNIYDQPVEEIYSMYIKYKHLVEIDTKMPTLTRPKIDMEKICEKYKTQIEEVKASSNPNISHDLPLFVCFSCKILHKFTQVSDLVNLRSYPENSHHWDSIILHNNIDLQKIKDSKLEKNARKRQELLAEFKGKLWICHDCKTKFKENKLPPKCVLNNMDVCPSNSVIESLNDYERLLISRAHSFRTILTATNKSGRRNIPSHRQHKKTTGVSIHLPLDIDTTLKTVLSDEEVLNTSNLELSVSSKAGRKKIVWQDVVDIEKVYRAIKYLKDDAKNPHYTNLPNLPGTPQEFAEKYLQGEIPHYEYDPDVDGDDPNVDNLNVNENADVHDDEEDETHNDDEQQDGNNNINEQPNIEIQNETDSLLSKLSPEQIKHNKEYYTIMQIHNDRKIDAQLPKYGLNKVEGEALSDFTQPNLDTMTHPDLYYNGHYGENDPLRQVKIGKSQFAEARLMSADPRFRQDKMYLFDLVNSKTKRDINSAIFQTLNCKKDGTRRTAEEILKDETVDKEINTIFSKVRGTDEYMKIKRCDTETMLTNYGPATWFLTLSPNEWLWEDLKPFLSDKRVNPNLHEKVKNKTITASELAVLDPVMFAVFIENRFQSILKFITSKSNPLGEVSHYAIRREYQGRLVSHFHCMLWVDAAPTIGINSDEEIANYIQAHCTCELPPVGSKLHEIVKNVQVHRCNEYCTRTYQIKNNRQTKCCRFKFPRQERDTFLLNDLAASAAAKKTHSKIRLYELPRTKHESNINDYNPILLYMWWSNMDLQFIKEPTCTVSHYIGKYAFKTEETNLNADFLKSTKNPRSTLWSIGLKGLAGREVGTIEAADTLLGHFLVKTDPSTIIRFVDTSLHKFRKLKTKQELLSMESSNSTDIFVPNNIDDRYPNRPDEMEDCNLFDYIANYDYKGLQKTSPNCIELKNGMGYICKRSTPTLISHRKPNKFNNKEEYYRNLLLLFKAYRNPIDVKTAENYEQSFYNEIQANMRLKDYEAKITDMYESREKMKKRINEERILQEGEPVPESFDFTTENSTDMLEEFVKANEKLPTNYEQLFAMLNQDQKHIFVDVVSRLHVQLSIPVPENMKDHINSSANSKQILKFVSGVGGTGKSFLISAITAYIKNVFKKDVALVAPTGIAASNINGFTVHRFLKLPVQHNSIPKYAPLNDQNLNECVNLVKNVTLWFMDEVSMINNITLQYIHKRMCEINGSSKEAFGKNNIIFVGDLLQLVPIQEDQVFEDISPRQKKKYLNNLVAPQLWRQLEFNELTINQRQQEDPKFAAILNNIREGNLEENEFKYLEEKCKFEFPENASAEENKKYLAKFVIDQQKKDIDYTILLPTNKLCREINNSIVDLHHDTKYPNGKYILAKDIVVRRKRKSTNFTDKDIEDRIKELEEDPRNTAGLERNLRVKLGSKCMLRKNIDIPNGLCNGAIGTLVDIVEMDGEVDHLVISFNGVNHRIERTQSDFFIYPNNLIKVTRSQFPVTLSYCLTVHKSQGLTLKHAIMDCGQDVFSVAQIYVALSRVKKAENLKLLNFRVDSIKASHKAINEYNRLRRKAGLRSHDSIVTPDPTRPKRYTGQKYKHQQYTTTPSKKRRIEEPPIFTDTGSEMHSSESIFGTFKKENSNYANALLHCLFETVNPKLIDPTMRELFDILQKYKKQVKQINTRDLTKFVMGEDHYNDSTVTPEEFFEKLILSSKKLQDSFKIKVTETTTCVSPDCLSFETEKEIFVLQLIHGKSPNTVPKILDENKTYFTKSEVCKNCQGSLKIETSIEPSSYIVLKMNFLNEAENKNQKNYLLKIKAIPSTNIAISNQTYTFTIMIQHIGHALNSSNTRYAAILKKNKVPYIIREDKINRIKSWPDCGVDAAIFGTPHLLFFKRK